MKDKEKVLQQFGRNAANYVTSTSHAKGDDLHQLVQIIAGRNRGGAVLDVATGGGHVANALAPLFQQVIALDLTPEMLEKAKGFIESNGNENVAFVQGDAENLPFPDSSFGTVTCRIAAHHFPDVRQFVREVCRVLQDNGLFILVDNVAPEIPEFDEFYNVVEKARDHSHVRAYKKTEWIAMLEEEGFTVENMAAFKKKFLFDNWCGMMDLHQEEKEQLNAFMMGAAEELKQYFLIEQHGKQVHSFQGQSMLLTSIKR
ncbi:class I SAM-dependent methyltransferase [Bacillus sp. FJAT-27251]|uniref:class I SAM-dependent methyltransferase n=1 Tax=Bacillus sp. FJAT-27251 TaxID=1684142 RepID=UPI0006A78C83|nr:class I SAM-dependent methyltransferase [Bacillus sp. FJAT-27251]